jgi:hypothetical protein
VPLDRYRGFFLGVQSPAFMRAHVACAVLLYLASNVDRGRLDKPCRSLYLTDPRTICRRCLACWSFCATAAAAAVSHSAARHSIIRSQVIIKKLPSHGMHAHESERASAAIFRVISACRLSSYTSIQALSSSMLILVVHGMVNFCAVIATTYTGCFKMTL